MKNRFLLILLISICATINLHAQKTIWELQGVEYAVDTLSHSVIGPGTTQTSLALTGPVKLRIFYTTTDMTNPNVNLKMIMGKDNLTSNVTVPNMPTNHSDNENIYFAGVNADFIGGLGPVGTTYVNGEIYKSYKGTGWYAIGIDKDKKLYSGATYSTFRLVSPNAGQASIKAINIIRSDNELILYTFRKGTSTGTSGIGVEVGAVPVVPGDYFKSEGTTKMRVTNAPVRNKGNMTIPSGGFVLSGTGFTADIIEKMQIGEEFEITPTMYFDNIVRSDIMEIGGGCPMLLQNGKILETQGILDHLSNREPRTAVGYSNDGKKAILLVVDGRQPGVSVGVTSKDLAAILLNLNCYDALNFDGGGSSTLYVKDLGVINNPSQGSLRAVKNGLFITTPTTNDKTISEIRFADYVAKLENNNYYSPIIYGYNAQGLLIETNLKGISLSCDPKYGIVQNDKSTILCNVNGTFALTAKYGDLEATISVTVTGGTGVSQTIDNNNIKVFPNPLNTGGNAYININEESEISIFNANGRLMSKTKSSNGIRTVALPTESLLPGFYLITVNNDHYQSINKLIIK